MTYGELVKKLRYCGNAVSCLHCPYWEGCAGSKEDLIEAADVIEKLKILADNGEATYEIMVRQTSYIEELKQKIPHWIPVTERLPEDESKKYLIAMSSVTKPTTTLYDVCWFAKDIYKVDRFDFPNEKNKPGFYEYDSEYGFIEETSVTHWMPLPEAPKEGE